MGALSGAFGGRIGLQLARARDIDTGCLAAHVCGTTYSHHESAAFTVAKWSVTHTFGDI